MIPRKVGVFLAVPGIVLMMAFGAASGQAPQTARKPTLTVEQLLTAAQIRSDFYSFNPAWAKKDWSK